MGKQSKTIDKNANLLDMLLHWSSMHSLAQNMSECSDLCFLRFFRLLYKKDKRFLALFLRSNKHKLIKRHYLYAKDCLNKLNIEV